MLKDISIEDMKRLCELQGEKRGRIITQDLTAGTIIRADTRTENIYFLEAETPRRQLMGITRCKSRPLAQTTGFLGVKLVNYLFQVGEIIYHGNDETSRITKLTILNPKDIES